MSPIALGFRAARGGSIVIAVTSEPRVVLSAHLPTAAAGDRLSLEPYHVAAELARDKTLPDAVAAVAEGRKRQAALATTGLNEIVRQLKQQGHRPSIAALLVNRAGWITDLLQHSLSAPEHPPIAEGLAVRDALRFAFGECGIAAVDFDEKSLAERASAELGLSAAALDVRLKELGSGVGKPWRKEHKLACLAAWLAAIGT